MRIAPSLSRAIKLLDQKSGLAGENLAVPNRPACQKDAGYPSEKALHGSENSITPGCAWQENAPLELVVDTGFVSELRMAQEREA
jgi:hypothetical protein